MLCPLPPLASGSVGIDCSVYSQSVPHCAVSEVREEAQETQEESKRPGSVGTEVLQAAKAQSTRDCRRVNISKGDKHYVTRKKILHSSPSSVFNRQSSSKHQASRLQQNLNFRHQSRGVQRRPVGISSSPSARAEECSGGQWGPPPSPGTASRSRGPSWSRSGSCRGSPNEAAVNKLQTLKTLKTLKTHNRAKTLFHR